jgi:hypothetical protein
MHSVIKCQYCSYTSPANAPFEHVCATAASGRRGFRGEEVCVVKPLPLPSIRITQPVWKIFLAMFSTSSLLHSSLVLPSIAVPLFLSPSCTISLPLSLQGEIEITDDADDIFKDALVEPAYILARMSRFITRTMLTAEILDEYIQRYHTFASIDCPSDSLLTCFSLPVSNVLQVAAYNRACDV